MFDAGGAARHFYEIGRRLRTSGRRHTSSHLRINAYVSLQSTLLAHCVADSAVPDCWDCVDVDQFVDEWMLVSIGAVYDIRTMFRMGSIVFAWSAKV